MTQENGFVSNHVLNDQRLHNAMRDGGVPDEWADYDRIVQGYAEGMLF